MLLLSLLQRRRTMTSLSCLTAIFLAKGFHNPVLSFVSKAPSAAVRCSFRHHCSRSMAADGASSLRRPRRRLFSSQLGLAAADPETAESAVPITLLSGFLGSGKTTTLQHLLENKEGLKIGVIVNDMASVNIDAKLVKNTDANSSSPSSKTGNIVTRSDGIIELQNGCACCSLADELVPTIETLIETTTNRDNDSGDAKPFDAIVVELSGVGDPVAIQQHWKQQRAMGVPITQKADMKRVVTLIDASTFGTDWMTWEAAGDRNGWTDPVDDCAAGRKVPELLAEQIESADVLLLNKIDLAGTKQLKVAELLARSINDKAVMEKVEFGKIASPTQIIRDDKAKANSESKNESETDCCTNPSCTSHDHSHSHESHAASEEEQTCEDEDCNDPDCSEHGDANESTHDDHSHSHSHATHTDNLGIVNFVYKADRPFETRNLMSLLNTWPVPIKEDLEGLEHFEPASAKDDAEPAGRESAFFGVLRSKGFCWLAPTEWGNDQWRHDTVMYWSHAGKHFGVTTAGKWWATLEKSKMKEYFKKDPLEYERILKEDFVSEQWGDRRQELVFIGVNIDQEKITKALDNCLVGEKGMERYSEHLNKYADTWIKDNVDF